MCPASCRIAGTSGSETKFCQPSASQSKSAQTRASSLGSRKTVEPLDPCCLRFSAPFVEKISRKRSKSSTFVVARIISLLLLSSAPPLDADGEASVRPQTPGRHRANALSGVDEVVLEGPERRRGPAADAGLLVDVLDVVPDGLGRDAEILGDLLVGLAAHEHEEDFQLALGQPGRQLARSLPHAVAGGSEHRVDSFRVEPPLFGLPHQ